MQMKQLYFAISIPIHIIASLQAAQFLKKNLVIHVYFSPKLTMDKRHIISVWIPKTLKLVRLS